MSMESALTTRQGSGCERETPPPPPPPPAYGLAVVAPGLSPVTRVRAAEDGSGSIVVALWYSDDRCVVLLLVVASEVGLSCESEASSIGSVLAAVAAVGVDGEDAACSVCRSFSVITVDDSVRVAVAVA